ARVAARHAAERRADDTAGNAQQLPDDFPHVAPMPTDAQHPEVGARMRTGMPLPEDMRALEVGKGRVQVSLRTRLRRDPHFRLECRFQFRVHESLWPPSAGGRLRHGPLRRMIAGLTGVAAALSAAWSSLRQARPKAGHFRLTGPS